MTITPSSYNITTVTACDSYTWNGTVYTTSGIKTGTTTGCVTEKLNLTITVGVCESIVNLKLFIEGYYEGAGLMRPVKNNQDGVSPTDEVEDITVKLHDTAPPYSELHTTCKSSAKSVLI